MRRKIPLKVINNSKPKNKCELYLINAPSFVRLLYQPGIDKLVPDFEAAEPGILEAVSRPLDNLTETVSRPSRVINWIKAVARYMCTFNGPEDLCLTKQKVKSD